MNPISLSQKTLFLGLLGAFIVSAIAIGLIDTGLRVTHAPNGILSYEFCGFEHSCWFIVTEWGERGRMLGMLSLGFDYLFMLVYAGLICVSLLILSSKLNGKLQTTTRIVGWLALSAALFDGIENYFLIESVLNNGDNHLGKIGGYFASIKFAVLAVCLPWLLTVWIITLSKKHHG